MKTLKKSTTMHNKHVDDLWQACYKTNVAWMEYLRLPKGAHQRFAYLEYRIALEKERAISTTANADSQDN